ncbi:MAG: CPBP family intramembrane metalloprotease [Planctomycetota bacterium]|nr:MAG: CPBP family intramembrane metalloprotease [Planctomycetota bacterium]
MNAAGGGREGEANESRRGAGGPETSRASGAGAAPGRPLASSDAAAAGGAEEAAVRPTEDAAHPPLEALGLLCASMLLFAGAQWLGRRGGVFWAELAPALGVLAWILPAYLAASRRGHDPLVAHGLLGRPRGLLGAGLVSCLLLGLYVLAVAAAHGGGPRSPVPWGSALGLLVHDLCFVALPEEYFFRGVLQPALEGRRRVRWVGAEVGRGLVVASLLFALCHLVWLPDPRRLLVFFPSLWFGWLRGRTGSVLPGVLAHALANATQYACASVWAT